MMYLYQLGFVSDFNLAKLTLAGSYYDWRDMDSSRIGSTAFGGGFGNTVNSAGILELRLQDLLDLIGFLDFKIGKFPVRLFGEYTKNKADNVKYNTAWHAGFIFGKIEKPCDWDFMYKHAYIENDAVVGAFADGDFLLRQPGRGQVHVHLPAAEVPGLPGHLFPHRHGQQYFVQTEWGSGPPPAGGLYLPLVS